MSRRIAFLASAVALSLTVAVGLSSVAQAGPSFDCGNGVIEPPETCDDSNTVSGDGCSGISCKAEVCGDNIVNPDPAPGPAEQCDEGGKCTDGTTDCVVGAVPDPACAAIGDGSCSAEATATCDATCQSISTDPMTADQQKCVNAANKGAAGVAKAQNGANKKCLSDGAKGKLTGTFNACLIAGTNDPTSKVGKAKTKSNNGRASKCTAVVPPPPFAYVEDPTVVNQAMIDASTALTTDLFGDPAAIVAKATDKDGAKCQAALQKDVGKSFDKIWGELNKAKKKSLKDTNQSPGATNNAELVADLGAALAGSQGVSKAIAKVTTNAGKKCPQADVQPLFPGDCSGGVATQAATLAACAQRQIVCRACESLNAADATGIDCDALLQSVLSQPTATCLVPAP